MPNMQLASLTPGAMVRIVSGNPSYPLEGRLAIIEVSPLGTILRYRDFSTGAVALRLCDPVGNPTKRVWVQSSAIRVAF